MVHSRGESLCQSIKLRLGQMAFLFVGLLARLMPTSRLRLRLDQWRRKSILIPLYGMPIYLRGRWVHLGLVIDESGEFDFPASWLSFRPGEVGFVVGANRGEIAFHIARQIGHTGLCIALEPGATAYLDLLHLIYLNQLANILPMPLAAGARPGRVSMSLPPLAELWGDVTRQVSLSGPADTRMVDLDSLVRGLALERVDFVVLDVEGYEAEVLQGMREAITRFQPRLYIELHGTWPTISKLLTGWGYRISEKVGDEAGRAHLLALPSESGKISTFATHGGHSSIG